MQTKTSKPKDILEIEKTGGMGHPSCPPVPVLNCRLPWLSESGQKYPFRQDRRARTGTFGALHYAEGGQENEER